MILLGGKQKEKKRNFYTEKMVFPEYSVREEGGSVVLSIGLEMKAEDPVLWAEEKMHALKEALKAQGAFLAHGKAVVENGDQMVYLSTEGTGNPKEQVGNQANILFNLIVFGVEKKEFVELTERILNAPL